GGGGVHGGGGHIASAALLWADFLERRPGRGSPGGTVSAGGGAEFTRQSRNADRRHRTFVPVDVARRAGSGFGRVDSPGCRQAVASPRGISRRRSAPGKASIAPAIERPARSAFARPLSSEGDGDDAGRGGRAAARPRAYGESDRLELLRDGRRIRLRGQPLRGLVEDGRTQPASGGSR